VKEKPHSTSWEGEGGFAMDRWRRWVANAPQHDLRTADGGAPQGCDWNACIPGGRETGPPCRSSLVFRDGRRRRWRDGPAGQEASSGRGLAWLLPLARELQGEADTAGLGRRISMRRAAPSSDMRSSRSIIRRSAGRIITADHIVHRTIADGGTGGAARCRLITAYFSASPQMW